MTVTQGRPHVMLKLAISADGKVGLAGRKPAQITGEVARERVFQMRAQSDAILVGIGTVLSDNPQLTCRLPGMMERSPVRVVLDAKLRMPLATSVLATVRETPTWVVRWTQGVADRRRKFCEQRGCKVFRVDDDNGKLDLDGVLKLLAGEGITRLMVEGGPTVAASFVAADLVDEAALHPFRQDDRRGRHRSARRHGARRAHLPLARARQRGARARYARTLRAGLDVHRHRHRYGRSAVGQAARRQSVTASPSPAPIRAPSWSKAPRWPAPASA